MNWLDLLLVIIIMVHFVNGFSRGLVKMFFDIVGFIVVIVFSLLGSRLLSGPLSNYIDPDSVIAHHAVIQSFGIDIAPENTPQLIAGVIVFLVLFILLSIFFRVYAGGFRWINRIPVIGLLNRIGGGVLGALVGAVFVYIIISALSLIPLQLFKDGLTSSSLVVYADLYFSGYALELKRFLVNFYAGLPSEPLLK